MENFKNLNRFFDDLFKELNCQPATKSYIISIFTKYQTAESDLSKQSLTLLFAKARENQDFATFQQIADWILYTRTYFPQFLQAASPEYYIGLGQLSYYSCYRLINRKWLLFQELADQFEYLEMEIKNKINQLSNGSLNYF